MTFAPALLHLTSIEYPVAQSLAERRPLEKRCRRLDLRRGVAALFIASRPSGRSPNPTERMRWAGGRCRRDFLLIALSR
jgi:hypothetical protein